MEDIKSKIEDFGEKIGGAKKDIYTSEVFNIDSLKDFSHRELIENTIKKNVFKKPNYEKLVNDGLDKTTVYFMKVIYDSFPTKFKSTRNDFNKDKEIAVNYINLAREFEKKFYSIKSIDDINKLRDFLKEMKYIEPFGIRSYSHTEKSNGIDLEKLVKNSRVTEYEIEKAKRKIRDTNFPSKQEAWRRGYSIRELQGAYAIVKSDGAYNQIIQRGFKSSDEAENYLNTEIKAQKEKKKKVEMPEPRPQLRNIRRVGQDYRNSKDITTENFMETFRFRGGEFGNWNTQSDRQQNLNLAYDSFLVLSKVLKISPRAISLNNQLAIAFGSRGSGKALAHYEPGRVVINLTKMKGAGSLAHEWGHALDDFLAKNSGNIAANSFMSEVHNSRDSKTPKVVAAFKSVMDSIQYKVLSPDEVEKKYMGLIKENKDLYEKKFSKALSETKIDFDLYKDGLLSEIRKVRSEAYKRLDKDLKEIGVSIPTSFDISFNRYDYLAMESYQKIIDKDKVIEKDKTDFYKSAEFLDSSKSKAYFTKNVELFARAFESYVEEKLKQNNLVSDYLVHGTGFSPYYVTGREKDLIFPKIEQLIESIDEFDRSELINEDFKLIEDSYINNEFKEKEGNKPKEEIIQVEEINGEEVAEHEQEEIINSSEFRFKVNDNETTIAKANEEGNLTLITFAENGRFSKLESNITRDDLREFLSTEDFELSKNTEDLLNVIADSIVHSKEDLFQISNSNELEIKTLSETMICNTTLDETGKCHNISVYDNEMNFKDNYILYSKDELQTLFAKSPIVRVGELSNELRERYKADLLERTTEPIETTNKVIEIDSLNKSDNEISNDKKELLNELDSADTFSIESKDKKVILTPSMDIKDNYNYSYVMDNEEVSSLTLESKEKVVEKLVEDGFTKENIFKKGLVKDYYVPGIDSTKDINYLNGNIGFNELKEKGAVQVIRLNNANLDKLSNLKQDYCCIRNENYTSVVVLKSEKLKALESLELRNKEVSKVPYNDFKLLNGKNHYILMDVTEFKKIQESDLQYSAFEKENGFNVVIKEKDLEKATILIGREIEKTLGNTKFEEIKKSGGTVGFKVADKEKAKSLMDKLLDNNINFTSFHKDNKYNFAIRKTDIDKVKPLLEIIDKKVKSKEQER